MNKTITLITGNIRKVESLQKAVSSNGYTVEICRENFPEIQANTTTEVASFSAQWGANKIGKPCVKMDSGFYVEEFNNFPGVYVRWVDEGLGVERFFNMMKNIKNRRATINCSVAYCEPDKDPMVFSSSSGGHITDKLGKRGSFVDRLFVPDDYNPNKLTLGELREVNPDDVVKIWGGAEKEFIEWLSMTNSRT